MNPGNNSNTIPLLGSTTKSQTREQALRISWLGVATDQTTQKQLAHLVCSLTSWEHLCTHCKTICFPSLKCCSVYISPSSLQSEHILNTRPAGSIHIHVSSNSLAGLGPSWIPFIEGENCIIPLISTNITKGYGTALLCLSFLLFLSRVGDPRGTLLDETFNPSSILWRSCCCSSAAGFHLRFHDLTLHMVLLHLWSSIPGPLMVTEKPQIMKSTFFRVTWSSGGKWNCILITSEGSSKAHVQALHVMGHASGGPRRVLAVYGYIMCLLGPPPCGVLLGRAVAHQD